MDNDFEKRVQELEEEGQERYIQERIRKGIDGWKRTICITSTSSLFGFFVWLGHISYDKFYPLKAAIIAFIQADKGIK